MLGYEQKRRAKKWIRRLLIGGAVAYVALTGCQNSYKAVRAEQTHNNTMALTKSEWRKRMTDQIMERKDIPSDLERLAINYIPEGVYPTIGDQTYRNHKQFCIDYFLKSYKERKQQGHQEYQRLYGSVKDTIQRVLEVREEYILTESQ